MCRYAFQTYKPHLACFDCRKTFRRRLLRDVSENASAESMDAKCPECVALLADMGLDFKSPPKNDIKAWKHASELYEVGITFHSCGCSGPGYIPKDRGSLLKQLEKSRDAYVENLRAWKNYEEPKTKKERVARSQTGHYTLLHPPYEMTRGNDKVTKDEVVEYWTVRLEDIEQNINTIKNKL